MIEYTRLTVVASARTAELVVPSDETVGALIPHLMDLLQESARTGDGALTLVTSTGEQLDPALSSAQQAIADGALLRLVRIEDAPPPPEVTDVTDTVAEARSERRGLWSDAARHAVGAVAIAVLSAITGFELSAAAAGAGAILIGGWLAACVSAMALARGGMRTTATFVTAVAIGLSAPLGTVLVLAVDRSAPIWFAVGSGAALAGAALGIGFGVGLRDRAALLGAVVAAPGLALAPILVAAGVPMLGAFGICGTVAVAACGFVPWYALSASGLTGLDDQVVAGNPIVRDRLLPTLTDAYRTMTWVAVALAVPIAACASVLLVGDSIWAVALGAAIVIVTAARTRAFPLAGQATVLWLAVIVPLAFGTVLRFAAQPVIAALIAGGAAIVIAVFAGARPAHHQRARLRRFGDVIESIAVIAMLPLLLGLFGVFADLLGTF